MIHYVPPTMSVTSTAYCLPGVMADGSNVRSGSVAMNLVPLGRRIKLLSRRFHGRRNFTVRDRIGWGTQLDFWASDCGDALRWGRKTVRLRVVG